MAKITHLALLCAVVILGMLIPPVMAAEAAPGEHLYRGFDYAQNRPDIDGNVIVWEDNRNGQMDIYSGTIDGFRGSLGYTGERITTDPNSQEKPSISGNHIVWQDNRSGNWDIYLYDRSSKNDIQITTGPGKHWLPAISGNYVAWYHKNNGRTNIALYDITEKKVIDVIDCDARTTIPGASTEFKPALSEKYIAWVEDTDARIRYYDIAAGKTIGPVSASTAVQCWPSLSGSLITWEDYRGGDAEIYMTDLADPSREEVRITSASNDQVSPAISGSIVAWEDKRGAPAEPRSIYLYDLSSKKEKYVFLSVDRYDEHLYPAISGNTIVWQRGGSPNSNLYIFVYEPEASVEPIEPVVTTIEVKPAGVTLEIGESRAFQAAVLDQDDKPMTGVGVAWASSDETVGTIDATGVFTAHAAGTTTITATADGVSGTAAVTVTTEEPVLKRIEVTPPTATVAVGETRAFAAACYDQFDNPMNGAPVTWTCSDGAVGTIDAGGLFTAKAAGSATITATAGEIAATATVTVTAAAEDPVDRVLTSLKVTPPRATLAVGDDQRFIVTACDQHGNVMPAGDVAWTSSDETVGTVGADGIFAALAAGTATVTATAGGVAADAAVTVIAAEPALAKIVFVTSAVALNPGDEWQFEAVAFNCYGDFVPDAALTWSSSDPAVGTVDECGLFVALCAGTTTITASGDCAAGTATVTVCCDEPVLSRIAVSPPAITMNAGDEETFAATAFDQYGNVMPEVDIAWATCDETVGTIDADGHFIALDAGTTTITATADGVTATADVTVICAAPGVVVSPPAVTLDEGETRLFTATLVDPEGSSALPGTVVWSCDDETVGTIDEDGLFVALCEGTVTVTATVGGSDEIVATQVDGIEETGTAVVTVRSACPVPARIALSPSDFTIAIGNSLQLTETVYDQYGCVMPDAVVVWESSDPQIGYIGPCGLFGPNEAGEVIVTASVDGISGSACVTVGPPLPSPARVEVDPATTALAPWEIQEFVATVYDSCDNELDWVRVAWLCSDSAVGTIDRAGLFAAFAEGSAEVKALAGDVEGTAAVTVTTAPASDDPGNNDGSTGSGWSDSGGDSGPTFDAGMCENLMRGETFTYSGITTSSVGSVAVTAANTIPKLMVTVKETKPSAATAPPTGDVYEYVEINLYWANPNDVENAAIVFTIPADWLHEHGMAPEDVRLMRCVGGAWQSLETEVVGEENGLYRFRATTAGFSTFAIAAAAENATTAGETNVTTGGETNATANVTTVVTTEATTVPATTTAAPLVYAPLLAPLAFLLWRRKNNH